MSTEVISLWPSLEEIGRASYTAPAVIMRQQAEAISAMTNNLLEGQVESISVSKRISSFDIKNVTASMLAKPQYEKDPSKLQYVFYLRAPALDGVKVELFRITHSVAMAYPLVFNGTHMAHPDFVEAKVENEGDFRYVLRNFFHSEEVIKILQSLIAQSVGPEEALADPTR